MGYYDMHIEIKENLEEVVKFAKMLEYAGILIALNEQEINNEYEIKKIENLKKLAIENGIDIIIGLLIKPKNKEELKRVLDEFRKKVEIVAVSGGIYEINRAACEDSRVDILYHPELGRNDSGLDHICVKAASENNVAIEINFNEILQAKNRPKILTFMRRNVKLCKKYGANVIITSGAKNKWEMRAPRELASIGYILGMDLKTAIDSVSIIPENIIKTNREKLNGRLIKNVRVVDEF
ncbi:MAG: RNase P subunit p30 family protein [Candidatus Aenigmatarchaeota archaeon]